MSGISHWFMYCSKGGCWLTWHPSFSIPTCCKLQNSHGFLWNNWWKKFKLLSETILVAKYCTVSQICTLKGGHFSLLLGTIFVRVLSTGAGKNLPLLSWNSLIFTQSVRDSLELQSSLSPLIASQVQLALFHLLNIPSIDYLKLSVFYLSIINTRKQQNAYNLRFHGPQKRKINGILRLFLLTKYHSALKKEV